MTVEFVSEFISNVGFPIAVTGALFYQMMKTSEANNKKFDEFKEVIQSNTHAVTEMRTAIKELKEIVTELKYERKRIEKIGDDYNV